MEPADIVSWCARNARLDTPRGMYTWREYLAVLDWYLACHFNIKASKPIRINNVFVSSKRDKGGRK
jgi:hypothetical protein